MRGSRKSNYHRVRPYTRASRNQNWEQRLSAILENIQMSEQAPENQLISDEPEQLETNAEACAAPNDGAPQAEDYDASNESVPMEADQPTYGVDVNAMDSAQSNPLDLFCDPPIEDISEMLLAALPVPNVIDTNMADFEIDFSTANHPTVPDMMILDLDQVDSSTPPDIVEDIAVPSCSTSQGISSNAKNRNGLVPDLNFGVTYQYQEHILQELGFEHVGPEGPETTIELPSSSTEMEVGASASASAYYDNWEWFYRNMTKKWHRDEQAANSPQEDPFHRVTRRPRSNDSTCSYLRFMRLIQNTDNSSTTTPDSEEIINNIMEQQNAKAANDKTGDQVVSQSNLSRDDSDDELQPPRKRMRKCHHLD